VLDEKDSTDQSIVCDRSEDAPSVARDSRLHRVANDLRDKGSAPRPRAPSGQFAPRQRLDRRRVAEVAGRHFQGQYRHEPQARPFASNDEVHTDATKPGQHVSGRARDRRAHGQQELVRRNPKLLGQ
jgi:hypothetical protein